MTDRDTQTDNKGVELSPGEPEMITSCRRLLAVAETNPELFRRLVRGETEDVDPDLVRHMERVRNSLQGQ